MGVWMPGVERVPTAAFGYSPPMAIRPVAIVSHIMAGYQGTMVEWARERPARTQKSAHFSIGRAGRIVQHVPIDAAAWHAGGVDRPTWRLLRYSGGRPLNPNLYTVGIEHEGFSVDPREYPYDYLYSAARPWPEAMVAASVRVQRWVCAQTGIVASEDTVIGHRVIDGVSRAHDPGAQWPQQRIIAALRPQPTTPAGPALSPKWDERQLFRVWRANNSGRIEVAELPEADGKQGWTVRIPRNTP